MATQMGWAFQFAPTGAFSLEADKTFNTLLLAENYIKTSKTAYKGNTISVTEDGDNNGVYYVKSVGPNGELVKLLDENNQGQITPSANAYVLEHSINELENLASDNIESLDFNISNLIQAVKDNKVVLIKYYASHDVAAIPCACYSEDTNSEFYVEIVLEGKLIKVTIDLYAIVGDNVTVTSKYITIKALQEKLEDGVNIKTINNESILGKGNIKISTSTILDFTVEDVYRAHQEDTDLLGIETKSIVTDIDNKEQIYIYYDEQKQGIIPCGTYRGDEDYYYILFIADNNAFKLHIIDGEETVYIDSIINLEDIKAEIEVDSQLSVDSINPVQNKVITTEIKKKANANAIPENVSELNNDSGFVTASEVQENYQPKGEYLTEIPSEYITEEILKNKNYATIEEVELRNVGAVDTDESEEEPEIGGGGNGTTTPSGDPMHYMFELAGAEYNDTDEDNTERTGIDGDTITWKAGHWYLNELGDITNEEMREIYLFANLDNSAKGVSGLMQGIPTRTNIATWHGRTNDKIKDNNLFNSASALKTAIVRNAEVHYLDTNANFMFTGCGSLEKIFPTLDATSTTSFSGAFYSCLYLREVRIMNVNADITFDDSPLISKESILFLIRHSAATSPINIILHSSAKGLINDPEIKEALSEKTYVTLKS